MLSDYEKERALNMAANQAMLEQLGLVESPLIEPKKPRAPCTMVFHAPRRWTAGKFAVLRHEPEGTPSKPNGWNRTQDPL